MGETNKVLKISATLTLIFLTFILMIICWIGNVFAYGTQSGTLLDLRRGSRVTDFMFYQPFEDKYTFYFGTQSVTGGGTTGYITGSSTSFPKLEYNASTLKFNFTGAGLQTVNLHIKKPESTSGIEAELFRLEAEAAGDNSGVVQEFRTSDIRAQIVMTDGVGSYDSRLEFRTADGSLFAVPITKMIIMNNGNVGIGITTPNSKLHIAGHVLSQTNTPQFRFANASNSLLWSIGCVDGLTNKFYIYEEAGGGEEGYKVTVDTSGNVGIGTTTPSNILTLPIASATDPIADAWTVHCLSDYKEFGTETTEIIQSQSADIVRNSPVSIFKRKPFVSEIKIEEGLKAQYREQVRKISEKDMRDYRANTGVAGNNDENLDELIDNLWDTKPDKAVLIATKVDAEKAELLKLHKFQKNNYAIVAENAPPEAQVYDKDGNLQGVSPMALIGILWSAVQKQQTEIENLKTRVAALELK